MNMYGLFIRTKHPVLVVVLNNGLWKEVTVDGVGSSASLSNIIHEYNSCWAEVCFSYKSVINWFVYIRCISHILFIGSYQNLKSNYLYSTVS